MDVDPGSADSVRDPTGYFHAARERSGAVQWSGAHRAWVALSHAEVEAAFRDTDALSADRSETFQGCSSYGNLHAHHVEYRSAGGSDVLANLVTLCAAHHWRGVHTGRIRIRGRAPEGLRFEMPLATYAAGDVRD